MKRKNVLLLSALILCSCSGMYVDERWDELEDSNNDPPQLIKESRMLIEQNNFDVQYPSMGVQTQTRKTTKGSTSSIEICWNEYSTHTDNGEEIIIVPMRGEDRFAYYRISKQTGRTQRGLYKQQSTLIIRQDKSSQDPIVLVGTYVFPKNYTEEFLQGVGLDFNKQGFTGFYLVSNLDGTLIYGERYMRGEKELSFKPNPTPPTERKKAKEDANRHKHEKVHLYLDLQPEIKSVLTKSLLYSIESDYGETCSFCGEPVDECECIEVVYCDNCKKPIDDCTCDQCPECEHQTCICCDYCGKYPCECSSHITPGGGSGGGGSYNPPGNNNDNDDENQTEHIFPLEELSLKASETIAEMINLYGESKAVCNLSVQHMFQSLFGSGNLPPGMTGLANNMVQAWLNNPNYWTQIDLEDAQHYANLGYFTVVGWINPTGGSGHVAVVVPGEEFHSANWKCFVPMVMDSGANRRDDSCPLSNGIGPDKKEHTNYFYYNPL